MKRSKFSEAAVITILKQGDAEITVGDICSLAVISKATYCHWVSMDRDIEASDLNRVMEL